MSTGHRLSLFESQGSFDSFACSEFFSIIAFSLDTWPEGRLWEGDSQREENKARGGRGYLSSNWGLPAFTVFFNYFYQMAAFLFSERVGGDMTFLCTLGTE